MKKENDNKYELIQNLDKLHITKLGVGRIKKKQQNNFQSVEDIVDVGFEQILVDDESAFEIHKLLHNLEEPYKEVFTLRFFGDLSFLKIAELFGKTESWARVTYHRARIKLKERLI